MYVELFISLKLTFKINFFQTLKIGHRTLLRRRCLNVDSIIFIILNI